MTITVGADVYPLPEFTILAPVITPFVWVTFAVAWTPFAALGGVITNATAAP